MVLRLLSLFGVFAAGGAPGQTAAPIPFAVMPTTFLWAPCSSTPGVPTGGDKYYVSPTGSDKADGKTLATAFKTVNHAFSAYLLKPGDVLLVAPGTYNEVVQIKRGGVAGACVTLMGMPGQARPVITWSKDSYPTINVWSSYVRVSGLSVTHPEPTLKPTVRSNPGNSAIDVYSAGAVDPSGVFRPTVHHVQVDNNEAFGAGCGGISLEGTDYVLIYGNTAHGNTYTKSGHCSGISIYEPLNLDSAAGYHEYIVDNYSFGNTNLYPVAGPSYTTDESGVIIDDSRQVQRKLRSPTLNIQPYSAKTLIFGNIIYGNGGHAVEVYNTDNVDVFNNVGYGDLTDNKLMNYPNCGGELFSAESGNIRFVNNIIVAGAADLRAMSQVGVKGDLASNLWTRDIVDTGEIVLGTQNAGNAGAAALYGVDPEFLSPSITPSNPTWAFRLHSGSPARGAGAVLSIAVTDAGGTTLAAGAKINIGAYLN
jgi:serralysin